LDYCIIICEHFLNDYKQDRDLGYEDCICFSYSPKDNYHVHNSNLGFAEGLSQIGKEISNDGYIKLAKQCANYAIRELDDQGGLNYWAKDQMTKPQQDGYHCGFEVRHLLGIGKNCHYNEAVEAAKRRYSFFVKNFIGSNGEPLRNANSNALIDIHACAEAVLVNEVMTPYDEKAYERMNIALIWNDKNMRRNDNAYIYRIYNKDGSTLKKEKMPYIRWGQAWMFFALANALKKIFETGQI
jgi:hypothetical protein